MPTKRSAVRTSARKQSDGANAARKSVKPKRTRPASRETRAKGGNAATTRHALNIKRSEDRDIDLTVVGGRRHPWTLEYRSRDFATNDRNFPTSGFELIVEESAERAGVDDVFEVLPGCVYLSCLGVGDSPRGGPVVLEWSGAKIETLEAFHAALGGMLVLARKEMDAIAREGQPA